MRIIEVNGMQYKHGDHGHVFRLVERGNIRVKDDWVKSSFDRAGLLAFCLDNKKEYRVRDHDCRDFDAYLARKAARSLSAQCGVFN